MVWSYSIWLESVAIIPQLYMIAKIKDVKLEVFKWIIWLFR